MVYFPVSPVLALNYENRRKGHISLKNKNVKKVKNVFGGDNMCGCIGKPVGCRRLGWKVKISVKIDTKVNFHRNRVEALFGISDVFSILWW